MSSTKQKRDQEKGKIDRTTIPLDPHRTTEGQARYWKIQEDKADDNDADRERIRERELENY